MTLIVGAICPEGIVIGSDSQTTVAGELKRINRPNPKIIELQNKCIVFSGAGDVCVLQEVEEKVNNALEDSTEKGLESLREKIEEVIFYVGKKNVKKYTELLGSPKNMPSGDFVFASCKNHMPLLCHFGIDGSHEKVPDYIAVGTGMPYAEVLLKDSYRFDMSLDDVKYLVYAVIKDTEDVDNYVGGGSTLKL